MYRSSPKILHFFACITIFILTTELSHAAETSNISPAAAVKTWVVRLPSTGTVTFKGVVDFDKLGVKMGSMLYPVNGAGLIGLLAGVLTHGAIVDSELSRQKEKVIKEADNVLLPYQPILNEFTYPDLLQIGLTQKLENSEITLIPDSSTSTGNWVVESTLIYFLTQDQSALVLDNNIAVYAPENLATPIYQFDTKAVSSPEKIDDRFTFWSADGGKQLKRESAVLFIETLNVFFRHIADGADANYPTKTVRYPVGDTEKIERAQIIGQHCDRLIIKDLRSAYLSVPTTNAIPGEVQCTNSTPAS